MDRLAVLEERIGVTFKDKKLLGSAIVHPSYLNESKVRLPGHYQRLEFVRKNFGSFAHAMKAAGFKAMRKPTKHYTRETLISDLRKLVKRLGRAPQEREVNAASKRGQCPSIAPYRRTFGTLKAALKAAKI